MIKKYQFEKKLEKKRKALCPMKIALLNSLKQSDSPSKIQTISRELKLKELEDSKFTPNRINYNFDVTSPYYINITHRKFTKSSKSSGIDEENEVPPLKKNLNLFDLTERNLHEFSKTLRTVIVQDEISITKRRSYISGNFDDNFYHNFYLF